MYSIRPFQDLSHSLSTGYLVRGQLRPGRIASILLKENELSMKLRNVGENFWRNEAAKCFSDFTRNSQKTRPRRLMPVPDRLPQP